MLLSFVLTVLSYEVAPLSMPSLTVCIIFFHKFLSILPNVVSFRDMSLFLKGIYVSLFSLFCVI